MSGEWGAGYQVPTLQDLCTEYKVARVTARQAVQSLVAEGLLSSQRGRRTFVISQSKCDAVGKPLFSSIGSIDSRVNKFSVDILSIERGKDVPAGYFKGEPSGPYVRVVKVEKEGDSPYCHSDIYVTQEVFDAAPHGMESYQKLARLVRDHSKSLVAHAAERLRVGSADYTDATRLRCEMASPVARVKRVFCDEKNRLLYYAMSTYSGERFEIENDLLDCIRDPRSF